MSMSTKFKLRVLKISYEHMSMGHFLRAHEHRSFLTSTVSTKKPYEHEHKTLFRPYEHEHDTLFRAHVDNLVTSRGVQILVFIQF